MNSKDYQDYQDYQDYEDGKLTIYSSLWSSKIQLTSTFFSHTVSVGNNLAEEARKYIENKITSFTSNELKMDLIFEEDGSAKLVGYALRPVRDEETKEYGDSLFPYFICSLEEFSRSTNGEVDTNFLKSLPKYAYPTLVFVYQLNGESRKRVVNLDNGFASWIYKNLKPRSLGVLHELYSETLYKELNHSHDYWWNKSPDRKKLLTLEEWFQQYPIDYNEKQNNDTKELMKNRQRERDTSSVGFEGSLKSRSLTPINLKKVKSQILIPQ